MHLYTIVSNFGTGNLLGHPFIYYKSFFRCKFLDFEPLVLDSLFVCRHTNICVNHFCGEGSLIQQPNQKGYSNDPQKYKGMMEKIDITATGVVDSIRNKMAVATVSNKGLMVLTPARLPKPIKSQE